MVTFKKIIEAINDEFVQIEYYAWRENFHGSMLYLKVFGDEAEQKKYEGLDYANQKQYATKSPVICIPKMTIYKCENIHKEYNSYDFEYTKNKVNILNGSIKKDELVIAAALYMVLHEFGHWYDLKSKKNNVYEYAIKDKAESEAVHAIRNRLMMELPFLTDTAEVKKRQIEWIDKYNSTPIEKRACDYADNVFNEVWAKIRCQLTQ